MTIQQVLRKKSLSRYQLSKRSGIPWATLTDICSGKTSPTRCGAGTLGKLSAALDIPIEELLTMTAEQRPAPDGRPKDHSYPEKDLPASLQKALDKYIQGEKNHVSHMDCLWGELYGAINFNQWSSAITLEQADYPRVKYLYRPQSREGAALRCGPPFRSGSYPQSRVVLSRHGSRLRRKAKTIR